MSDTTLVDRLMDTARQMLDGGYDVEDVAEVLAEAAVEVSSLRRVLRQRVAHDIRCRELPLCERCPFVA